MELLTVVPSYIGGFMALVWSSNKIDMKNSKLIKRKLKIKTTYYNEDMRKSAHYYSKLSKITLIYSMKYSVIFLYH